MKAIPEIQAERQRLFRRLEEETSAIKHELEAIKSSLQPIHLLESVIEDVTESVETSQLRVQITKLVISILPIRWSKHPIVATGIRMAMPWLLEKITSLGASLNRVISWQGIKETLAETVAGVHRAFKQT